MVNNTDILFQAYNDDTVVIDKIEQIDRYIKEYPYFQPVWAIKTRFLKIKNTYAASQLQQTAARSIDRTILFEYLEKTGNKEQLEYEIITTKKEEIKPLSTKLEKKEANQEKKYVKVKKERLSTEKHINIRNKQTAKKPKKKSYIEWLKDLKSTNIRKNRSNIDLIEKFLTERPKIVPKKNVNVKTPDIIEKSIVEKQMLMTETLANLYVKQKKYEKAIQAFRILSLKYPKKSSYFANQIKEIKQKLK